MGVMFTNFADLLALWTVPELQQDLGIEHYQTAAAMLRRGTVAIAHWDRLILGAARKGYVISTETLAGLSRRAREERAQERERQRQAEAA